jgi:hypothetical protein
MCQLILLSYFCCNCRHLPPKSVPNPHKSNPKQPFLQVPSKQNPFHTVKTVTKPRPKKQHAPARENNIGNHPLVGVTALAICHPVHQMTALLYLNMACICRCQLPSAFLEYPARMARHGGGADCFPAPVLITSIVLFYHLTSPSPLVMVE